MINLNIFNPSSSKIMQYENDLTKSFLSAFKLCKGAYKRIEKIIIQRANDNGNYIESNLSNPEFDTQVGKLPHSNKYLSVLISDKIFDSIKVEPVNRKAYYDGVISYGQELTIFIESKKVIEVGDQFQLNPSKKDVQRNSLCKLSVSVSWSELIDELIIHRNSSNCLSHESVIINDLIDYFDKYFPELRAFDNFSRCITPYLAQKRIYSVLTDLSSNNHLVEKYPGWGWRMQINQGDIDMIGLLLVESNNDWTHLNVECHYGLVQSQARIFYQKNIDYMDFENVEDWKINVHLRLFLNQTTVTGYFDSSYPRALNFYNYYRDLYNSGGKIGMIKIDQLESFYENEQHADRMVINEYFTGEINNKLIDTDRQRISMSPGVRFNLLLDREIVENLDRDGKFVDFLRDKINNLFGQTRTNEI